MRKIVVVVMSFVLAAAFAGAATAEPVKTGSANEIAPAATTSWLAWTQSPADHPNRTHVRAEEAPFTGTDDFRVNPDGTRAWTGGIEGTRLVYQQIADGDSNIRLFNLSTRDHLANPAVNTDRWEWHPSISTDSNGDTWILFGRQNTSNLTQRIFAFNHTTNDLVRLAETENARHSLIPGQVNGNWATWTACRPDCNVRRANLLNGNKTTVPHPDFVRHQYAGSVSDEGTVYFARSGRGCGANVRIMRRAGGDTDLMVELPDNRDTFFTYVSDQAPDRVYFDRVGCRSGAWNIYRFTG